MNKQSRALIATLIIIMILISGFATWRMRSQKPQSNKIQVAASFYPLYEFAKQVGGDKVDVTNITPPNEEPHDYDPSPTELVTAQNARLFIYDGATIEPWVDRFLPNFKHTIVKASNGVHLYQGEAEGGDTSPNIKDPHFWLDPVLAKQIVTNIKNGLTKVDPQATDYFTRRADAYNVRLAKLDEDYKVGLKQCQTRTIITSHAAFGYLGRRYNLTVVPIAGLSPDEEPSAAKLANLAKLVKQKDIQYVFFESLVSPRLADTIASETGAKTLVFDPIEGISQADQQKGRDYISVQEENLRNLKQALACS